MRVAVVGAGVAGLTAASMLHGQHEVTLFERDGRLGGHAHTHDVRLPDADVAVDTGFLVYSEPTYPHFADLLRRHGVATTPSDMSFSVTDRTVGLEWAGHSLRGMLARPSRALRTDFLAMLRDVLRFNAVAPTLGARDGTLREFLGRWPASHGFVDWYLVPLLASIWSADPSRALDAPAATVAVFLGRHGLLQLGRRPEWRTVLGGSRRYVEAVAAPLRRSSAVRSMHPVEKLRRSGDAVEVVGPFGVESFDHVVLAVHADQALGLLSDADRLERSVLGALRYQSNRAVLHTDTSLMPSRRAAWASWNYRRTAGATQATLTYHLNRLQRLETSTDVFVTLNLEEAIDPACVLARMDYEHPVLDAAAVAARVRHGELLVHRRTSYCGAYWGDGFHEDGVASAVRVCRALGVPATT